jgi:16S rRNA (cytosine967-C5)-methyltransferase
VEGTVERRIQIDYVLSLYSKTKVPKLKPIIRVILREGVYQILFLDRVPDSAAINEAVKLTKQRGLMGLSGFVNAVLRSISREKESLWEKEVPDYVKACLPEWMYDYFITLFGKEETDRIAQYFVSPEKANNVRFQDGHTEVMEGDIAGREDFLKGEITVQDYASQQVSILADPKPGDEVLDVCAAPGGKACHIAKLLKGTGHVDARDLSEGKAALIRDNIRRLHVSNVSTTVHDARVFDPTLVDEAGNGRMDIVLADLPCSGLGIIGKKPDIRDHASMEGIQSLQKLQREILDTVVRYVKPGGKLLYSTCTLTKEEDEENRDYILSMNKQGVFTLEKEWKLMPGKPSDGFYIAVFRRS